MNWEFDSPFAHQQSSQSGDDPQLVSVLEDKDARCIPSLLARRV